MLYLSQAPIYCPLLPAQKHGVNTKRLISTNAIFEPGPIYCQCIASVLLLLDISFSKRRQRRDISMTEVKFDEGQNSCLSHLIAYCNLIDSFRSISSLSMVWCVFRIIYFVSYTEPKFDDGQDLCILVLMR